MLINTHIVLRITPRQAPGLPSSPPFHLKICYLAISARGWIFLVVADFPFSQMNCRFLKILTLPYIQISCFSLSLSLELENFFVFTFFSTEFQTRMAISSNWRIVNKNLSGRAKFKAETALEVVFKRLGATGCLYLMPQYSARALTGFC